MSSCVGALLMPLPAPPFGPSQPDQQNTATLDPALDVLGAFFRAMLEHYCGEAWANIAPGEPIVRVLSVGHDPEALDFHDGMLPLLALWRDGEATPVRLTDSNVQSQSQVHVLWVAAPADEQKLAARSPFFLGFVNTMKTAFQQERDPCWVRAEDVNDVVSRTYGSYVWGLAGIDNWTYAGTRRVPLQVANGSGNESFPGYLASWSILESTSTSPSMWGSTINGERVGTEATEIKFDLTDIATVDPDDALVRQSALVPATTPEE